MIRLVAAILIASLVIFLLRQACGGVRRLAARRPRPRVPSRGYDWEHRTDQLRRRLKAVSMPEEDREAIVAFMHSRKGVEAYMEPKTMAHQLSVVFVADDGEWVRFELQDDAFMRALAATEGLPVYDAGKVGYPERMRRYKKKKGPGQETDPRD